MSTSLHATLAVCVLLLPSIVHAQTAPAEGRALYTEGQADRGEEIFDASCGSCHNVSEFSGATFMRFWGAAPLGQFYQVVRSTMPQDAPASLDRNEYTDILAYILSQNELPSGDVELPADPEALMEIRLETLRTETDSTSADGRSERPSASDG